MKAKTIGEIHSEAEKTLKLRPGSTAIIRNNRVIAGGVQGGMSPGGYPINRPGTGGMMPGMPGAPKMPGMPGIDNENWEVPRSRSMPRGDGLTTQTIGRAQPPSMNPRLLPQGSGSLTSGRSSALLQGSAAPPARQASLGQHVDPTLQATVPASPVSTPVASRPGSRLSPEVLKRKSISLLEEYFSVRILDEALACVEELKSPDYHPEFVKEAISLALEKSPPCVEPVAKLLEHLFSKKVLSAWDIKTGTLLYGSMLDDIGIDVPKAPSNFGDVAGKLILAGGLDFNSVAEVLKKMEDDMFQRAVFDAATKTVGSSPSGQAVLDSQASDMEACKSLF